VCTSHLERLAASGVGCGLVHGAEDLAQDEAAAEQDDGEAHTLAGRGVDALRHRQGQRADEEPGGQTWSQCLGY
jgi:hypothetical protein